MAKSSEGVGCTRCTTPTPASQAAAGSRASPHQFDRPRRRAHPPHHVLSTPRACMLGGPADPYPLPEWQHHLRYLGPFLIAPAAALLARAGSAQPQDGLGGRKRAVARAVAGSASLALGAALIVYYLKGRLSRRAPRDVLPHDAGSDRHRRFEHALGHASVADVEDPVSSEFPLPLRLDILHPLSVEQILLDRLWSPRSDAPSGVGTVIGVDRAWLMRVMSGVYSRREARAGRRQGAEIRRSRTRAARVRVRRPRCLGLSGVGPVRRVRFPGPTDP